MAPLHRVFAKGNVLDELTKAAEAVSRENVTPLFV